MAKRSPLSYQMTVAWITLKKTMKFLSLVSVVPVTPSVIFPVSDSRSSKSPTSRSSPSSTARRKDQDHKSIRYLLINHGRIKRLTCLSSFRMSVTSDSVTTETQSSTSSFSLSHRTDSTDTSITSSISTSDDYTSIMTTDGHLVGSVETGSAGGSYSKSYTTGFSLSKTDSTESDNSSYTSFEKARFTLISPNILYGNDKTK